MSHLRWLFEAFENWLIIDKSPKKRILPLFDYLRSTLISQYFPIAVILSLIKSVPTFSVTVSHFTFIVLRKYNMRRHGERNFPSAFQKFLPHFLGGKFDEERRERERRLPFGSLNKLRIFLCLFGEKRRTTVWRDTSSKFLVRVGENLWSLDDFYRVLWGNLILNSLFCSIFFKNWRFLNFLPYWNYRKSLLTTYLCD